MWRNLLFSIVFNSEIRLWTNKPIARGGGDVDNDDYCCKNPVSGKFPVLFEPRLWSSVYYKKKHEKNEKKTGEKFQINVLSK